MNKVISGQYYDTDEAKEIANADNGYLTNDYHYYAETLYQKENGDYFLYLEGGGLSPVRTRCCGNSWTGGEAIKPLNLAEAKSWVEENCDGKTYIALFGEVK